MKNLTNLFCKKKVFFSFLLILFSSVLSAQILSLPGNANFFDYLQAARNSDYFSEQDTTEGGFKSRLTRHELLWGSRLYPHGDFSVANRAIINYANNYQYTPSSINPNWICLGPSNTPSNRPRRGVGQIHRITFAPGFGISNHTLYASSGFGGLWRSEDNAENWHMVNTDNLPLTSVADVAVCPTNGNTIFIATGDPDGGVDLRYSANWGHVNPIFTIGVYRSIDYGQTWHTINTGLMEDFYQNGGTIRKMEVDKNDENILFLATSNGIYKTSNALAEVPEWIKVFDGFTDDDKDFRTIKFKPGSSNVIYASSNNIFKSIDGGITWNSMTGAETGLDFTAMLPFEPVRINLAVTPANNSRVFAYIYGKNNGLGTIYIYYHDGFNWHQLYTDTDSALGAYTQYWMGFAVSSYNPNEYWFYGSQHYGIMGSPSLTTPPTSFGYISDGTYADGHVLEFAPPPVQGRPSLFFGHHGGVSVGANPALFNYTWTKKNKGLANLLMWSFDDSEFYKDIIVTGKQDHAGDVYKNGIWYALSDLLGDSYTMRTSKVNNSLFFEDAKEPSPGNFELLRGNINTLEQFREHFNLRPNDIASPGSKTDFTKTYQIKSHPNTIYDFFTFSELYKRKLDVPIDNNFNPDHLWEVSSDIGKIEIEPWKRQLTEYDFCYTHPDHQYLTNGANFNGMEAGYWFEPILAKTTTGGLENGQYYLYDAYEQLAIPGIAGEFPIVSGIAVHPEDTLKVWISLIGYDNITMRVAYSQDGGDTWSNADPNGSLPALPVNNIVYQYGSNDVLYLATDAGVYYKDASMQNWEKYGDFPNVRVMELKINYCQNKLRVATFGRSLWEADLMPFTHTIFYEIKSGEDIVWTKDKALHSSLRIKSGGKLTVEGFLSMPANSKIIVEDGATLVVEGGTIANKCGEPWEGIEVWGKSSTHQFPDANGNYQQGRVILNDATIENALCALSLWKPGDYTKTGGMVWATGSKFINNAKSLDAQPYQNFHPYTFKEWEYRSWFKNCEFKLDQSYPAFQPFSEHVKLIEVNGFKFTGCNFSLSGNPPSVSEENQAIYAYNAGFSIDAICNTIYLPCGNWKMSYFSGFRVGVNAVNGLLCPYTFKINRTVFNSNTIGVLSNGVNNAIVINSEFYFPRSNNVEECNYGIFVQSASGFTFEDNFFLQSPSAPQANYIGIAAFNCQAIADVYKNTFTGLTAGNYAFGKNYMGSNQFYGLEYICNTNTANWADFYVSGNLTQEDNGIQSKQGSTILPARNKFSPSGANWHFYNEFKNQIDYYFCPTCPGEMPSSDLLNNVNRFEVNVSAGCPSHYGGDIPVKPIVLDPTEKINVETEFALANLSLQGVENLYNSLKDGGSTPDAKFDVATALPSEMWELRAKLLGDSPHLSTEVLKLVADRTDVFTEAVIFDILAANPDELKKEELIKYLEEKENPLPEYMISILMQVAQGTSYRTVLEMEMAKYSHERSRAAGDMIRSILNSEELDYAELRLWLSNLGGIDAERQIITSYAHQGDYALALALSETLPITYQLEGEALLDHNQFVSLLQLQQNLVNEARNIQQLTQLEQDMLREIVLTETSVSSSKAKGILEAFYGDDFTNCLPIEGSSSIKNQTVNPNQLAQAYGLNVTVKPNPASEWAAFDYTLPESAETATLEILDTKGKRIEIIALRGNRGQQLVDTRKWPAGQYVYTLKVAGFTQSGKLIVVK